MTPIVFVAQVPHRRARSGEWVAAINIAPAGRFGTTKILLDHQMTIMDTAPVVDIMHRELSQYSFGRGDCILMTGDPAIIAVAAAVVADYTDKFRILKWDKNHLNYIAVEVKLDRP